MGWEKMGMVFDLAKYSIPWLKSHAMLPSPLLLEDRIRVYFTGRDRNGISRVSFVDLKRSDPTIILKVHDRPLLDIGKPGTFDDSGTLGTCVVHHGQDVYLYYNGYNRRVVVPWTNAVGLAVSRNGGVDFQKLYEGPILDRSHHEPYFAITPTVLQEGNTWHMWYTCGTGWLDVAGRMEPLYVVKYAHSTDGVSWIRDNVTCIFPSSPEEATARATVVRDHSGYKMWFIYRGSRDFRDGVDSYRIGYAEGADPIHWTRNDCHAQIRGGPDEWDSRMQAYPAVIDVDGCRYLFYNGNGFGIQGFGCAVWR